MMIEGNVRVVVVVYCRLRIDEMLGTDGKYYFQAGVICVPGMYEW